VKKSNAVTILQEIVQEYDGCMINRKAARQILKRIEKEIGMVPPGHWVPSKIFGNSFKHEWELPKKKSKRKKK
jgi:hypothetical protein